MKRLIIIYASRMLKFCTGRFKRHGYPKTALVWMLEATDPILFHRIFTTLLDLSTFHFGGPLIAFFR